MRDAAAAELAGEDDGLVAPARLGGAWFLAPARRVPACSNSVTQEVASQVLCSEDFAFVARLPAYLPRSRPATFLDAGANIGMASLLFSLLLPSPSSVTSVEAHPNTYDVLKQNLGAAGGWVSAMEPVLGAIVTHERALASEVVEISGAVSVFVSFAVKEVYDKAAPLKANFNVPATSLPMLLVAPHLPHAP